MSAAGDICRVALVGPGRFILEALAIALAASPGMEACYREDPSVPDGEDPDVWVVSNGRGAPNLIARISQRPATAIVLLDMAGTTGDSSGWLPPAVAGTVTGDAGLAGLVSAIRAARTWVASSGDATPPRRQALAVRLSPRQIEVLRLLEEGASEENIARMLSLSRPTVRTHIQNAMAELGAHSRREAVVLAREGGGLSAIHPFVAERGR